MRKPSVTAQHEGQWTRPERRCETPCGVGQLEAERGEFLGVPEAREKINPAQAELIDRLLEKLL